MSQILEIYIRQGIPCLFQLFTGYYCPGCGGTRAARYLLHGEILKSIQYHPLVFYMVAVAAVAVAANLLARALKRPSLRMKKYDLFVYIGIVVIVINWIFKNYMLAVHGVDLMTAAL